MEKKTGVFHCQAWLGPEASEDERRAASIQLVNQMLRQVGDAVSDGRAYELAASFPAWAPDDDGWGPGYKRRRVELTICLADALTAEVGEWARELPYAMPDNLVFAVIGAGYDGVGTPERRFERGRLGWRRIE